MEEHHHADPHQRISESGIQAPQWGVVPHMNQNFALKLLQRLRRCFPLGQPYLRGRTVLGNGWVHHDAMGPDRWTVGEELVKKRMLSQGSTDIEWFFRALWAMKRELCFRFSRRHPTSPTMHRAGISRGPSLPSYARVPW